MSTIRLNGNSIALQGSGATVEGTTVTITSAGTYQISGVLDDGQVVVDTEDEETVVLVLEGADIACSTSAPIYVANAEKTVITLAEGTQNSLTDGEAYLLEDPESGEPNAALFSKDDLTINGAGSLTVNANYDHGIVSKDDLKITGGTITVNAVGDGMRGKDAIAIKAGVVTVDAGGDGLQASNADEANKGVIVVEGGVLDITAGLDGMHAETRLAISGGTIAISSGGGSASSSSSGGGWGDWGRPTARTDDGATESAKGIKAGVDVTITGGTIRIDSSDDALHSNDSLTIGGGSITLASGDDGIHADAALEISGGKLVILKSYEGIESAAIVLGGDANVHIVASDDGINTAGGNDGSSIDGRPGQNAFSASANAHLAINGGYIAIDAAGDGIDANGPIDMTAGTVIIHGPTANNNGALDYAGAFNVTGGLLVAAGSAGMAQAPSATSTQYVVIHTFASAQAGGTMVHIESAEGREVLTFVPSKAYQSIVLCSPGLENGATYYVYTGGRSNGAATDGLYTGGAYTAGSQVASLTISGIVTGAGAMGGRSPGGGGMRPPGRR
ncbi:MAG: carbohydrate-binding domain-containing protein [Anaerolineae bacterium]|nr:carbohydrate-binding domain-containing protein [Anaerolineae bacterium]